MNPYLVKLIGALAGGYFGDRSLADLEILKHNKELMESDTQKGRDNYYHRKGMCEVGQLGLADALAGVGLGTLKEDKDIVEKYFGINGQKKQSLYDILIDMDKDMNNNFDGLNYGLTNPEKSCTIWLKDLDEKTNTWKNK